MLPVVGVLFLMALGGRHAARLAAVALPLGLCIALAILAAVWDVGAPLVYAVGGWAPPLGIALRADGLSAVMVVTTALVVGAIGLFAGDAFGQSEPGARSPEVFWTLLMGVWAALNAVWLAGDLFTLYVALELLTFGAVPLVSLDGSAATLEAALRYLLFALVGSALYLLGVALIYGAYGTLDIALLAGVARAAPVTFVAAALMIAGLVAKTALFPLHLWLPPAHAGAPACAS
jgi:multicomponent Na+:H+ antiporter subunit D